MSSLLNQKNNMQSLLRENEQLRARLEEMEATIRAIKSGEVDALIVEMEDAPRVRHIVEDEILAQSILEQVADAVIICDDSGKILHASRTAKEMYDSEVLNSQFDDVFCLYMSSKGKEERKLTYKSLLFSESIRGFEVIYRNSQNENFYLLLSIGLLYSVDNELRGSVITLTDITDRKHAEAKLQHADKRKDEFLATLAHELRNPLAPINNAIHLVQRADDKPQIRKEAYDIIDRQLKQMVRLVDDLMDVSRITRNNVELRKENIVLADVIKSAVETSRPLIDNKRHKLDVSLPSEAVYLDADFTRMAQIFANLLNNAAKYTPAEGQISLSGSVNADTLEITIKDNGIGIDAAMLPNVFDMFTQVDSSIERSQGGLGIGLTLVKNLLSLHGGKITAKSAGLGRGSEFSVSLPINKNYQPEETVQNSQANISGTALRILVVDDNIPSAQTIGWTLELMGHSFEMVHQGTEVLSKALEMKPDVILLDIGLPGKSGYDICRELRANPLFANTKLIAQTGWGQQKDRDLAKEAGFNHHLVKPINIEELEKVLGKSLA